MSIGADTFNSCYTALPDCRAQLRVGGRTVVARCLVESVGGELVSTENGVVSTPDVTLRALADDIPAKGCDRNDRVEVMPAGSTDWAWYRIGNMSTTAGMAVLSMEAINAG